MSSEGLEKVVLGTLIHRPNYLEIVELDETLFSGREKSAFRLIAKEWEDRRPEEIDCIPLAEHLGGDGAVAFVSSLTTGLQKLSPEMFLNRVAELKKRIVSRRLASRLQKELSIELKTGAGIMDLAGIRADFDELDRLSSAGEKVSVISLATVEPRTIDWLWPGRIPRGMLTLLVGNAGEGKSLFSIFIAARFSRGLSLPDSPPDSKTKCKTLFILGEDPIAEAVRPRADANGADPSNIIVFDDAKFNLGNIGSLRRTVGVNPDVGLIVIDPLSSFLPPKTRYFEDPSIRQALQPLASLAEETGVAVLLIAHLRKAEAEAAIFRVAGSVGLAGMARSILSISRDEDDQDRRLVLPLKANYCRRPHSLAFRIGDDLQLTFEDKPVMIDVEAALSSRDQKDEALDRNFNVRWLKEFLGDGPKILKDVIEGAREVGISRATLFRLAAKLNVVTKGTGEGRFKTWSLPS